MTFIEMLKHDSVYYFAFIYSYSYIDAAEAFGSSLYSIAFPSRIVYLICPMPDYFIQYGHTSRYQRTSLMGRNRGSLSIPIFCCR